MIGWVLIIKIYFTYKQQILKSFSWQTIPAWNIYWSYDQP